jgi:hypothetical protein
MRDGPHPFRKKPLVRAREASLQLASEIEFENSLRVVIKILKAFLSEPFQVEDKLDKRSFDVLPFVQLLTTPNATHRADRLAPVFTKRAVQFKTITAKGKKSGNPLLR